MENLGTLADVVRAASLVLSIEPPAAATGFAAQDVEAMRETGARPAFANCNAVAPATVRAIETTVASVGAPFIHVGIVGRGPMPGGERTRLYAISAARRAVLDLVVPEIALIDLGSGIGTASALKVVYSSLNKGMDAPPTTILFSAERLDVHPALMQEVAGSQAAALARMHARAPCLPSTPL